MEGIILFLMTGVLLFGDQANDPIHEAWLGRQHARQVECDRMTQSEAHTRYPGLVGQTNPRATSMMQIDALVCQRRVAADGQRQPREEAILSRLDDEVSDLTGLALPHASGGARWYVDAFYPDARMVQKIAVASRTALLARGRTVLDQAPLLSSGDVAVLHAYPMRDAIPIACRRLFASGELEAGDAFLTMALLDRDETQLHAGVCTSEGFRWVR